MHFFEKKIGKKFASSKIISTFATANKPSAICPDGGIGRRAGLKHQWSNPSRFDPGSGYNLRQGSSCKSKSYTASFLFWCNIGATYQKKDKFSPLLGNISDSKHFHICRKKAHHTQE